MTNTVKRPAAMNRATAARRRRRLGVRQLPTSAMRRRPNVTVGITSQNGPLLYPYSPAYMASDRGGASVTVPTTTAIAKSWAPAWRRAATTAGISERLGMVGVFKVGYARSGARVKERCAA